MFSIYMRHVRGYRKSGIINFIMSPLAWISGLAISILDFLRRHGILKTEDSPLPLISVGNLTYGGTNKTRRVHDRK